MSKKRDADEPAYRRSRATKPNTFQRSTLAQLCFSDGLNPFRTSFFSLLLQLSCLCLFSLGGWGCQESVFSSSDRFVCTSQSDCVAGFTCASVAETNYSSCIPDDEVINIEEGDTIISGDGVETPVDCGSDVADEVCDAGEDIGGEDLGGEDIRDCESDCDAVNLYFSEYNENTDDLAAFEIYNAGLETVDLGGCGVWLYRNGSMSASGFLNLSGGLASGAVHVVCESSDEMSAEIASDAGVCHQPNNNFMNYTGNDALELVCFGEVQDVIGKIGEDSDWEGDEDLVVRTKNRTIRRNCSVLQGTPVSNDFEAELEANWSGYDRDDYSDFGERGCP